MDQNNKRKGAISSFDADKEYTRKRKHKHEFVQVLR